MYSDIATLLKNTKYHCNMYKIRKRKYSPANKNQSPSLQLSHKSATSLSALHKQALLSLFFFYYFQLTQRSMTPSSFLFFWFLKNEVRKKDMNMSRVLVVTGDLRGIRKEDSLTQEEVSQFICPSQTGCHQPGPFPLPPSPLSGPVIFRAGRVR